LKNPFQTLAGHRLGFGPLAEAARVTPRTRAPAQRRRPGPRPPGLPPPPARPAPRWPPRQSALAACRPCAVADRRALPPLCPPASSSVIKTTCRSPPRSLTPSLARQPLLSPKTERANGSPPRAPPSLPRSDAGNPPPPNSSCTELRPILSFPERASPSPRWPR
jgi:hypothetical protein